LPRKAFASLRALRDQFKYRVMYVVTTRLPMRRLRAERREIEPFEELMSAPIWLGPYADADARFMWRRLSLRHGLNPTQGLTKAVLEASGGHPGLLREIFTVYQNHPNMTIDRLAVEPNVQEECFRIWNCLSSEEQQLITALTNQTLPVGQDSKLEQLRRKGVVLGSGENLQLFSPLFSAYVQGSEPQTGDDVRIDRKRRILWVGGYEVKKLTRLEYELIDYLENKRGQACSRDELIEHLYPDEWADKGITDNRLDSVIKRLRRRVEPDPKKPRYIVTVRGHGFRLEDGSES
jgi:DNA-binding winged helix-turn-helix (wHTH) protein